jgi:indolepyruvate ferredoxin oxidoreductase alpha subunit
MKRLGELLLRPEAFSELMIGNAALVRAMIEAGVEIVTSYPGSPTPEIAEAIRGIPEERRPFRFEFSTNEKVATEVAFGAAVDGRTSVVFFKSVGLNVAADSFVQLPLMDIAGGMVVILGDDPGANSSQNEQDNRHYALLASMPLLEPANAQEAYEFLKAAVAIARARRTAVILRLTTHVCHMKEKVSFAALPGPAARDATRYAKVGGAGAAASPVPNSGGRFAPEASEFVPLAASVFPLKRRALQRIEALAVEADASALNRVEPGSDRRRGVIVAGLPALSLLDALELSQARGATARPDVLKLGWVNPLPRGLILRFLAEHDEVKVLEELDPVIEHQVKAFAYDAGLRTRILGKADLEEAIGEYTPSKVETVLAAAWPDLFPPAPARPDLQAANLRGAPARPPQLCPGCGHRSAFFAVKQALGADDITVADIGCHTLGHLPPYRMGRVLLSMGHAVSTASGLALAGRELPDGRKRRVAFFMGDSTFFHAALPGVVNAIYNRHDVLMILMENGTTAMTGHQDLPSAGRNFNGESPAIPLRRVLEGLGAASIREVDAYRQSELVEAVRAAAAETGFRVVIARHPCMLKLTKEARRKPTFKPRHVRVDQDGCTRAHVCVSRFGCPSFQLSTEGVVTVEDELCIGDGSCRQTCPSGAIINAEGGI